MALPVTITGISTAVAPVGPFKATNGNYYFFGRDGTTATTLQAYKAGSNLVYTITQLTTSASNWGNGVTTARTFQTFTSRSSDTSITSVAWTIGKVGSPTDNITADIYLVNTGTNLPTGSSLGTSTAIAASSFTTSPVERTFTFGTAVTISPSTRYAVVFSRSGAVDAVNYLRDYTSAAGANADSSQGSGYWNSTTTVWSYITTDRPLKVFGSFAAGEPDQAWSSIATKTGFTTAILNIAGYQVGNTIHLVVNDGTVSTSMATKYLSFNAATDTFLTTTETVLAAGVVTGTATAGWGASLVVRSNGNAVIFYNGAVVTSRARLYYRERTGVNTYGTAVRVDDNGTTDNTTPVAVLGAANRVHFFWSIGTTSTGYRTLSAANALPTGASSTSMVAPGDGVSYDRSGTIKVVITSNGNGAQTTARFDSSDAPTVTFANQSIADATIPHRIGTFPDTDDVTIVYRSSADSDLYSIKSTDDGATFGAPVSFFVGTVSNTDLTVSRSSSGSVYVRGSDNVVGYIVNDNGTLKYNEQALLAGVTGNLVATEAGDTAELAGEVVAAGSIDVALAATEAGDTATFTAAVEAPAVTGDLVATEASDTAALNAAVVWLARLSAVETADTAALASTVTWNAALQATEAADAAAFAATTRWDAKLVATEAADSAVFTATVFVTVTAELAATEAADTAAFTAATRTDAALNAVEAADSAALNANTAWTARLATIEAADLATFDANLTWRANLAAIEAADTSALNAATQWNARLAAIEAADIAAIDADIIASGSLVATEAADTAAFTAGIYATGRLLATEAADTSAITGQIVGAGQTAWLTAIETADAAALNAAVTGIVAAIGAIEAADLSALNGATAWAARLAAIEAADAASLNAATAWSARLAAIEAADTAALTGSATHAAALVATEAADSASIYAGNGWFANLAAIEAADTAAINATIRLEARLAAIETGDSAAINAGIYATGTLLASEAADTAAIAATTAWNSTLAAIETADTAAITATTRMEARIAAIEAADSAAINGRLGIVTQLAAIEAADSAAIRANVTNVILGRLAATEASDRSAIIAYVPTAGKVYDTYSIVAHRKPPTNIIGADVPMDLIAQQAASASRIARKTQNQNRDARK
jgi:hypothetical protein